ncbi:hypothetical protein MTO96_035683 [Rhipicephalus appendiculatus]
MSARINSDVGEDQSIRTQDTTSSTSSAGHCECCRSNAVKKLAAKVSNALDDKNACCEVAGTDANGGRQGGTQENEEESTFKCETDSSTKGTGGKGDNREKACLNRVTDSSEGAKGGRQGDRDKACSKCATDSTAKEKGGGQDNTKKACPKCASESNVGCKDGTRDKREMVGTKSATDSTTGRKSSTEDGRNKACSKCATNSTSGVKDETQDKAASRKHAEKADSVPIVASEHQDVKMSAREPDVSRESMYDSDVTMASVSDHDVATEPVSNAGAAVMPMSASLICLNCHSHLGIEISGVASFRPAQATAAISLPPFAQAPRGASAHPFSVPQASPGVEQQPFMAGTPPFPTQAPRNIQMCNTPPSHQHQVPTNAWWPFSGQVRPGFQMHGFAAGTQQPPSGAQDPSFAAQPMYNMQMHGYRLSSLLQPSMMGNVFPQVQVPSAFQMRGAPTLGQQQPHTMAAPPFGMGGMPAVQIPGVPMPGQFGPPYHTVAPPHVQPPLNAQMYNTSSGPPASIFLASYSGITV